MSFLSRLKTRIEDQKVDLRELGPNSRSSLVEVHKDSRPQTGLPPGKRRKQTAINTIDLENKILELELEYEREKEKNNEIKINIQQRQERYVKREKEYRATVLEYENKLNQGISSKDPKFIDSTSKTFEKIAQSHSLIIEKIGSVQYKTMALLKDQEMKIVREFNSDLTEKSRELEEEKKKETDKGEINQKESRLYEELEANKSKIDIIDTKNKYLTQKNTELKIKLKSHDQDKNILESQIQALRLANERLKKNLEMYKNSQREPAPVPRGKSARIRSAVSRSSDKEPNQYQSIINKLKRMIELEQKNTRAARTAYSRELQSKNELEGLLRLCVDDVKAHINKKKGEQRMLFGEKSIEDMEKVIEILLSQERVLTLLYDKTFPPRSVMKEPFFSGGESRSGLNQEEEYDYIGEIDQSIEID
jgi:hypothetical protein